MRTVTRKHFTTEERAKIYAKTGGKCAHCGRGIDVHGFTVDHVFPINKGGIHDEYNLLPLCQDCNNSKSNAVYDYDDYYKHVLPEYEKDFREYNVYATFDYRRNSIIGWDETLLYALPPQAEYIIYQMQKRHASLKKIQDTADKLYVSYVLRKAYPADAEAISKLINKARSKSNLKFGLYINDYPIADDIAKGAAYVLDRAGETVGAFIFKDFKSAGLDLDNFPQLKSYSEMFNLSVDYVMTLAVLSVSADPVFDSAMRYLETEQIMNGRMPVYFDILKHFYLYSSDCISIPVEINHIMGSLEFMTPSHMKKMRADDAERIFKHNDYKDYTQEECELFAEYLMKYAYQYEFEGDRDVELFFEKYPELKLYFKPESYRLYGIGFGNA